MQQDTTSGASLILYNPEYPPQKIFFKKIHGTPYPEIQYRYIYEHIRLCLKNFIVSKSFGISNWFQNVLILPKELKKVYEDQQAQRENELFKNTSNSLMIYLADSSFVSKKFLFDPDSLLFIAKFFFYNLICL